MKKEVNIKYNISSRMIADSSSNISKYEDEEFILFACGNIKANGRTDLSEVANEFRKHNTEITRHIHGLFILVVYEKTNGNTYVFQDRYTSPFIMYYLQTNDAIYLSTSLKTVLNESKINRELNQEVLKEFLINGFVSGNATLIENVNKLEENSALIINGSSVSIVEVHYLIPTAEEHNNNDETWVEAINSSIIESVADKNGVCVPLSAGYDSNYILHVITKCADVDSINCVSVGARRGRNEITKAKEIARCYPNVNFNACYTSKNTLDNLADIVERLGGACFEIGAFLQYELYSKVSNLGIETVVCGECADEIMNKNYLSSSIAKHDNQYFHSPINYIEDPFSVGMKIVLKKSGIISNSFGLNSYYPYLNYSFAAICPSYSQQNGCNKAYHKMVCGKELDKKVTEILEKSSGTTDAISLFESKKDIEQFLKEVENGWVFQQNKELIRKYLGAFDKVGIRLLLSKAHRLYQRVSGHGYEERLEIEKRHLEKKLRIYLCCKYLQVFNEKFVKSLD